MLYLAFPVTPPHALLYTFCPFPIFTIVFVLLLPRSPSLTATFIYLPPGPPYSTLPARLTWPPIPTQPALNHYLLL